MNSKYPYGPGQTKGGETSRMAQADAMANRNNDAQRDDVLESLMVHGPAAPDELFHRLHAKWRSRYSDDHQYLQDIRRRCSELKADGKAYGTGRKVDGIYGKKSERIAHLPEGAARPRKNKQNPAKALAIMKASLQKYAGALEDGGYDARDALYRAGEFISD